MEVSFEAPAPEAGGMDVGQWVEVPAAVRLRGAQGQRGEPEEVEQRVLLRAYVPL